MVPATVPLNSLGTSMAIGPLIDEQPWPGPLIDDSHVQLIKYESPLNCAQPRPVGLSLSYGDRVDMSDSDTRSTSLENCGTSATASIQPTTELPAMTLATVDARARLEARLGLG